MYKILKKFKDVHTKQIYKKGMFIDFSPERAKEIETNLDKSFIKKATKRELDKAIRIGQKEID